VEGGHEEGDKAEDKAEADAALRYAAEMDRPRRRKLLVASVGVAAVSYAVGVACGDSNVTSGNLPAPAPRDAANEQIVTSGNLPAPPPPDAGQQDADAATDAADASDASDAAND
jgi:hypothetical protein